MTRSEQDPFEYDGFRFGYPIRHFQSAIESRDDARLLELVSEHFADRLGSNMVQDFFIDAVKSGMHEAIRQLGKNSEVLRTTVGGISALQVAVFNADLDTLDVLLELGVDINATSDDEPSVGFVPVVTGDVEMLEQLTKRSLDINCCYSIDGEETLSLLGLARQLNRVKIVEFLEKRKAPSVGQPEREPSDVDCLAAWLKAFVERGQLAHAEAWFGANKAALIPETEILIKAAKGGNLGLVKMCVECGMEIDAFDFPISLLRSSY